MSQRERQAPHCPTPRSGAGGCDFAAAPELSALAQDVLWAPAEDPAVLIFAPTPDGLASGSVRPLPSLGPGRASDQGRHATCRGAVVAQVLLLAGTAVGDPVAALIPFDEDLPGRVEALVRFWRGVSSLPVPRDTRLTVPQRRRLRSMLQAVDGRGDGASYREIASAVFETNRTTMEPWKTSSTRDAVIGLARGGAAMIAGGYRQLLRHRRRRR